MITNNILYPKSPAKLDIHTLIPLPYINFAYYLSIYLSEESGNEQFY